MAQRSLLLLPFLLLLLPFPSHSLSNNNSQPPKKPFLRQIRSALAPFTLPWYEQGLHFSCTSCGKCCKVDGDVWLAPEETVRIARYLGYDAGEFRREYVRAEVVPDVGGSGEDKEALSWLCLKRREGACIFLDALGKCSIYDVRPIQCETYPFWPSIVATRGDWEDEAVVPDEGVLREGTSDRYWTAELGGCEGILLDGGQHVKGMDGGNNDGEGVKVEVPIVHREEIVAKMKAAKKHWKRFPVEEIKHSTWYL
ncbi:hypothetical protein HJC23_013807 [Cyclotella cryptica]|uniref:YkgJ family cysteine cluster protein n=1 Tax=Cyclotella cryptica TaxID=29204 RepID=A0ABD3NQY8_9STRA